MKYACLLNIKRVIKCIPVATGFSMLIFYPFKQGLLDLGMCVYVSGVVCGFICQYLCSI